ncbi:MAG: hypothetical protein VZR27_10080 [Acutalibacteraceae bacterium]|nr:hypothetical protein [Acutalibacteraceae bacterium]
MIEDFQNGERMFSGGLIVGNTFLICKGNAMIISYDDEGYLMHTRVRKRDVRTNHTSNAEFELRLRVGRRDYLVCALPETQQRNTQWDKLQQMIEQKHCRLYASKEFLEKEIRYASSPPQERSSDD